MSGRTTMTTMTNRGHDLSRVEGVQDHIDTILLGNNKGKPKTKIICTLGPESRSVEVLEELLRAGMSVARFNFSHGTHEYHQGTLDNLNKAMCNTRTMCAVMLDAKGPEIRTGFLKGGEPVRLTKGQEVTVTTDYERKGDSDTIALSHKSLARDVKPGSQILIADGSIVLEVLSCDLQASEVRCRCKNTATLGERKNCNLPGVNVDLPTLTEKDLTDILLGVFPTTLTSSPLRLCARRRTWTTFARRSWRQQGGPRTSRSSPRSRTRRAW